MTEEELIAELREIWRASSPEERSIISDFMDELSSYCLERVGQTVEPREFANAVEQLWESFVVRRQLVC